jgi:hypothetical protein
MRKLMLLMLLIASFGSSAQEQPTKVIDQRFQSGGLPFYVSYYGNFLTHPGIKMGLDWNLFMIEKTKEKRRRPKTIRKVLLVTPAISYYTHNASHNGLLASTDLAWRRYSKNLFYREISVGVGYFKRYNAGDTWDVMEDGAVTNVGASSRGYFSPSVSLSLGKRFNKQDPSPISVFTKLNSNLLVDYNASMSVELSVELGLRIIRGWGINANKIRTIVK